ncbi:MAG: hypothetical protein V3U39_12575, partial [Acidimicrobiia bacterium]
MRTSVWLSVLCAVALLCPLDGLHAQEHGAAEGEGERGYHRNHGATFLGVTTHLDEDDSGFTLGVEYTRRWGLWGAGFLVEMVSSKLSRDVILGVPAFLYPWRGLSLFVAPAAQVVSVDVETDGETEVERELELLLRFGTGYWF